MALTLLLSSTGCEGNKHNEYKSQCWQGPSHWITNPDCHIKYRGGHPKYCLKSTFLLRLFILNMNILSLCKHNDLYCARCFLFSSFGFWRGKKKQNNNRTLLCNPEKPTCFTLCVSHYAIWGAFWRDLLNIAQLQFNPDTMNRRGEQRLHKVYFPMCHSPNQLPGDKSKQHHVMSCQTSHGKASKMIKN